MLIMLNMVARSLKPFQDNWTTPKAVLNTGFLAYCLTVLGTCIEIPIISVLMIICNNKFKCYRSSLDISR